MEKIKRPKSRKFWSLLRLLPQGIRAHFLRRQFEVTDQLPDNLVLKQAETEDEIEQALHLVYESYLKLNYIDPNGAELRMTKYQLLPTSVILIAKRDQEVIGTLSIILDSSLKLPSDISWDLSDLRKNGLQIAEISALTIKKNELNRGRLLLPLCKLMYEYCHSILKLNVLVASTNADVEPFYTDLLLFKPIDTKVVRPNRLVKNAISTCCYLNLVNLESKYERVYNHKIDRFNLFKFFTQTKLKSIQLPTRHECLQAYTVRQTFSQSKILERFPEIAKTFSEEDRKVIKNLDITNNLFSEQKKQSRTLIRRTYRFEIRQKAWCRLSSDGRTIPVTILNISDHGFRLVFHEQKLNLSLEKSIFVFFTSEDQLIQFYGRIIWKDQSDQTEKVGCSVEFKNQDWINYYSLISKDFLCKVS